MPRKCSTAIVYHKMVFILEELLRQPYQTREELCNKWIYDRRSDGYPIEKKSFNSYRDQLEELFGVLVEKKREGTQNLWYIQNPEDLTSNNLFRWTMSALQMSNLLIDFRSLHNRILLEDFPSENGRLLPILKAMTDSFKIDICYRRYSSDEVKDHLVEPYCIKQYKRRLYLIAKTEHDHIVPFSLDRIVDIKPTLVKFHFPETFEAEYYFYNAFGIVVDNDKYPPCRVVLRATPNEACYLNDVPLHKSQSIIAETTDYTDYSYFLSVTDDLIGYILSRADRLMVISPESLAEEVRKRHFQSSRLYRAVKDKS